MVQITTFMTKYIFLLFSLSILSISNAQDFTENEFYPKFEIGVNTTNFIKTFLSLNSSNETVPSPLHIMYKKIGSDNKAFRVQLGVNAIINSENSDVFQNSTVSVVDLKIGAEKRNHISEKWFILYGVDAYLGYNYAKNTTVTFEEVVITEQTFNFGPSLFFGFAFNINPRMYLSSEANLQLLAGRHTEVVDFVDMPSQKFTDTVAKFETNVPNNLSLIVKF